MSTQAAQQLRTQARKPGDEPWTLRRFLTERPTLVVVRNGKVLHQAIIVGHRQPFPRVRYGKPDWVSFEIAPETLVQALNTGEPLTD